MPENILFFDVETTGLDRSHDEIIELSMLMVKGEDRFTETIRFKPHRDIDPMAFEAHGISIHALRDCDHFKDHADRIFGRFMRAHVIGGYNVAFDMDMIRSEFKRAGLMADPFEGKAIIDPFNLWRQMEPRTLVDAVKVFCGREMEDAHSAEADIEATWDVHNAMIEKYSLHGAGWDHICELTFPDRKDWIGPSHHIQWMNGRPCVAFGKNNEVPLSRIDGGFAKWVMGKDFPPHVKEIMAIVYEYPSAQVERVVAERFPRVGKVAA